MGDIPDASLQSQMPVENISGIGVAGQSAEPSEEDAVEEVPAEVASAVQSENIEFSEDHLGRNVNLEA